MITSFELTIWGMVISVSGASFFVRPFLGGMVTWVRGLPLPVKPSLGDMVTGFAGVTLVTLTKKLYLPANKLNKHLFYLQ